MSNYVTKALNSVQNASKIKFKHNFTFCCIKPVSITLLIEVHVADGPRFCSPFPL